MPLLPLLDDLDNDTLDAPNAQHAPAPAPAPEYALSAAVVPLLKGVVYSEYDPALWTVLLQQRARMMDYVAVLALELHIDEAEGYAFLRSRPDSDKEDEAEANSDGNSDSAPKLPRLVRRQQLSFPISLLLALLRKKLAEFDASGGETRLVLSRGQVIELMRIFLPTGSNESRLIDQMDTHLNKVVELGFVRRLKPSSAGQEAAFEVRRILKAFVDAQWLADFDQRLQEYQAQVAAPVTTTASSSKEGEADDANDDNG